MLIWGQWLGSNCLCQAFHFYPTPLSPVSGSGDVKYVMHSHSVRTKSLFPHVDTDHESADAALLLWTETSSGDFLLPVKVKHRWEAQSRDQSHKVASTRKLIPEQLISCTCCDLIAEVEVSPSLSLTLLSPLGLQKGLFPLQCTWCSVHGCIHNCNVTPCRTCPFCAV